MSGSGLIRDYLDSLSAELPVSVVEELADGLTATYESYLRQGLSADLSAEAAVAEFGEPHLIVAEFVRVSPARRAARRLIGTGPAVGAGWAAVLISSRAWAWPVPLPARLLLGLGLITVIALLAAAALGTNYRIPARAGIAGVAGLAVLDTVMIIGVPLVSPAVTWLTIVAVGASTIRITFTARTVRPLLID